MIILGTNSIKDTGFNVDNSLRFNSGSSDYLTRTFGTPTSSQKWTLSFWVKRCKLGSTEFVFNTDGGNEEDRLQFNSGDTLTWYEQNSSAGTDAELTTSQVFRDVSAWYHIVLARDSTQGTASNRIKLYVNGSQVTALGAATYPSQNDSSRWNTAVAHEIGARNGGTFVNLYMAEVCFIDGSQLAADQFGEFDEDSGIWKPIDVSGLTFGNNGFYLDFEDSSALGNDVSGNDNDFTVNNLTAIDQSTDTCTNNFATLNPLISIGSDSGNAQVLSQGNLTVAGNQASWCHSRGTFGASSGKWYWEAKLTGTMGNVNIGVSNAGTNMFGGTVQSLSGNTSIYGDGQYNINGSITGSQSPTFSSGDICGVALNMDDNTVSFYKNGTILSWGTNLAISGGTDDVWLPASAVYKSDGASSPVIEFNFGSPPYAISSGNTDGDGYGNFEYAVPSGYYALNTKNLAEYG